MNSLHFNGEIRNIKYSSYLQMDKLHRYSLGEFDVNRGKPSGIIQLDDSDNVIGYSKWVSPKRTRSYPFARIYKTYHLQSKKVTVIPIIKDEGLAGDNDRINFITFSWMNLLNVYIILAWYDAAELNPKKHGKITAQQFNNAYIQQKLDEIRVYHQTALHWNIMHFERDFKIVFENAINSYERISAETGVKMHLPERNFSTLQSYLDNRGNFDREAFKIASLPASFKAAQRELATVHALEYLVEGTKGYFSITNRLGGEYHLTADEILFEDNKLIIQESKNSSRGRLPSLDDIQDGLFKLILFINMDKVYLDDEQLDFTVRLKLTGNLKGNLFLPTSNKVIESFAKLNQLSAKQKQILHLLQEEATHNTKLTIQIGDRS